MFWNWSKLLTGLAVALLLVAPLATAHHENGTGQSKATVDDVLDDPQHYLGQDVTLEGEVDHIYSPTTFAMEDDQDLIGDDEILIISVMPAGARAGVSTTPPDMTAISVVEVVGLVEDRFEEGKIVRATGTVRMFDRAALEREFGTIDFGSADLEDFANKPVVVMGARQYAELKQRGTEQIATVIEPAPEPVLQPEPELAEPEPQPEPVAQEPAAVEPQPEPEPAPEELPKTASPMTGVALAGLLSLALGLGIRLRRNSRYLTGV